MKTENNRKMHTVQTTHIWVNFPFCYIHKCPLVTQYIQNYSLLTRRSLLQLVSLYIALLSNWGYKLLHNSKNVSRVSPGYLPTLTFILHYLSSVTFQSQSGNSCSVYNFQNVPQRVKFDTGSSVHPKVNSDAEWRRISKSATTVDVEFLEELTRVEWSCLCALANDAPASAMISWQSRKQSNISLSTTEAEYIAACSASCEAIWLRKLLTGLFDLEMEATTILCDNQSYIKMIENSVFHDRSKHIEIRYHYICDMVQRGALKLQYISMDEQVADVLTKPLSRIKFEHFRDKLGIVRKDLPRKKE
jgi:hypothetical protein